MPTIKIVARAYNFFSHSFTFAGLVSLPLGYYKLFGAFELDALKSLFFLSSMVLAIGIALFLFTSSFIVNKKINKIGLIVATFIQIICVYAALIPLLAIFFSLWLESQFFNFGFWLWVVFLATLMLYIFVIWNSVIVYIADFYRLKIAKAFIRNVLAIFLFVVALVAGGGLVSFGNLPTKVFDMDKATEIIIQIFLERGKVTQLQANLMLKEAHKIKK